MKSVSPSSALPGALYILEPWPYYLSGKKHSGIDVYCRDRHYAVAVEPGIVSGFKKGDEKSISWVTIEGEATGHTFVYKHTVSLIPKNGKVEGGEPIGTLDFSGKDAGLWFGYHLHFQVFFKDTPIDPVEYFLEYHPDIIFYMKEPVFRVYATKKYFKQMNIQERPF
jgi:murein DD-endopeptidase MepM/ murein hydrolase activator NlpD